MSDWVSIFLSHIDRRVRHAYSRGDKMDVNRGERTEALAIGNTRKRRTTNKEGREYEVCWRREKGRGGGGGGDKRKVKDA